jgi:hypothetical protein
MAFLFALVALLFLFAAGGTLAVVLLLWQHKVPFGFLRAGMPGYLTQVCRDATPPLDSWVESLSRSADIAWLLGAIALFVALSATNHAQ